MAKKQQAAAAPAPTVVPVVPPQGASLTTAVLQAHGYIVLFVALFFLGEAVGFSVNKIGEEREECSEGFYFYFSFLYNIQSFSLWPTISWQLFLAFTAYIRSPVHPYLHQKR